MEIPKTWYERLWFRVLMRGLRAFAATVIAEAVHVVSGRPEALWLVPILLAIDKYVRERLATEGGKTPRRFMKPMGEEPPRGAFVGGVKSGR